MLNKGAKLLCLIDGIDVERLLQVATDLPNWVKQGEEYTLRQVYVQHNIVTNEEIVSVLLEEIHNPPIWVEQYEAMIEPGFDLKRFAVIVDKPPTLDLGFHSN